MQSTDDSYAKVAADQRKFLEALADRIERGEAIENAIDRFVVVGVLRVRASLLVEQPPRGRGQERQISYSNVAIHYVCLRARGIEHNEAIDRLEDGNNVSDTTIKNALKKCGISEKWFDENRSALGLKS